MCDVKVRSMSEFTGYYIERISKGGFIVERDGQLNVNLAHSPPSGYWVILEWRA